MKKHKVSKCFYSFFSSFKKILLIFSAVFLFSDYVFSQETKTSTTVITITNARQTKYKKDEANGSDIIILEGDVKLSVQKDSTTSEISAGKITYDRKTEMLYAEENVSIVTKDSSSGNDTATADTLLLNTSTLEAVFDGGRIVQTQSDALSLPSGSTLIVFSQVFGRSESNVIAFKNSSLTFCDDDDPHWRIKATRTWLLPGGEFAFFNALLYVGEIPVLYLPAFYYPKDELIFNPVFGLTQRKGSYIQNTYYIKGRKTSSSSSSTSSSSSSSDDAAAETLKSLYNFMKPSVLKEQVREGLMYHNLDENYTGNSSEYLKVMADWYQNLGYMTGFEGVFSPSKKYMTSLNANLKLGLSNTIYKNSSGSYTFFDANGLRTWDYSQFMGIEFPLRYSGNLSFTISKPFSISVSLPFYSDPYFQYDFNNRSESLDWISYLMNVVDNGEDDTSSSTVSSFTWQVKSSYSPILPSFIKPYVSSLSMTVNSSVNYSSKSTTDSQLGEIAKEKGYSSSWKSYTPLRYFYYPSLVSPVTATASLSGTLVQTGSTTSSSSSSNKTTFSVALNKPDEFKTKKEIEAEKEKLEKLAAENSKNGENAENAENAAGEETLVKDSSAEKTEEDSETVFEYVPELPLIATASPSTKTIGGTTYKLGYTLAPNLTTQIAYNSSNLTQPADFDWKNAKSFMYTFKSPLTMNSNFTLGGDFLSLTNGLSYSPVWQEHPYMKVNSTDAETGTKITDGYTESEKESLMKADATASSQTITSSNTLSFKPFTYMSNFSDCKIGITSNIKLLRYELDSSNIDTTQEDWEDSLRDAFVLYTLNKMDADKSDDNKKYYPESFFTSNSIDMTLAAYQKNKAVKESFTLSSVIWPLTSKYSGNFSVTIPHTTFSLSTAYANLDKTSYGNRDDLWEWDPIQQSVSFSYTLLNSTLSLSESLSWDPEFGADYDEDNNYEKSNTTELKNRFQSFKLSGSWKNLSVSYVMSYALGADLIKNDSGIAWKNRAEKEFLPYSMSFSYSPKALTLFNTKLSLGLNTALNLDLIKPTNNNFTFVPSINLKTDVITVSFSSTSKNSVLYWYFHNEYSGYYDLGSNFAQRMLIDLIRSFNFGNENDRKASGYKLKTLTLSMSHDLHDWKFNMSMSVSPRLVTVDGKKKYSMDPYMTLAVVWNPMESIKTQIVDEYGKWELN